MNIVKIINILKILWLAFIFFVLSIILFGCAKPIYKVEVKEVLIPIKCNLEIPKKPLEDGSFKSHKQIAIYYKQIEQIAKDCTR